MSHAEKIKFAYEAVREAESMLCAAIKEAYPPGTEVQWERARGIQFGTVLYTSDFERGDRLKVVNKYTQKKYWITLYDIECAARRMTARSMVAEERTK